MSLKNDGKSVFMKELNNLVLDAMDICRLTDEERAMHVKELQNIALDIHFIATKESQSEMDRQGNILNRLRAYIKRNIRIKDLDLTKLSDDELEDLYLKNSERDKKNRSGSFYYMSNTAAILKEKQKRLDHIKETKKDASILKKLSET